MRKELFFIAGKVMRFLISVAVAVLIEVAVFNFSTLQEIASGNPQMEFQIGELSFNNWEEIAGGGYTSLLDPMIYVEKINAPVDTLTIQTDIVPLPSQYTLFYTLEEDEGFTAEKMMSLEPVTGNDTYALDIQASAIRIDPGEEAGSVLYEMTFRINEIKWEISFSRIIAMLIIWWGTAGLMLLQKPSDYGILQQEEDNEA